MAAKETQFVEKMKKLDAFIDSLPTTEGKLIVVLHHAQDIFGYLPAEVQHHIASRLNVHASHVYGVVTFYSFFNTEPKGKYQINVCMGTACFVRGSQDVLNEFEKQLGIKNATTSSDMMFSLDSLRCVGACGLAPVVSVNGKVYGRVTPADVAGIIEEYMAEGGNEDE